MKSPMMEFGLWPEFCDHATDEGPATRMPLQIDCAMHIARAVDFGPAMRTSPAV